MIEMKEGVALDIGHREVATVEEDEAAVFLLNYSDGATTHGQRELFRVVAVRVPSASFDVYPDGGRGLNGNTRGGGHRGSIHSKVSSEMSCITRPLRGGSGGWF